MTEEEFKQKLKKFFKENFERTTDELIFEITEGKSPNLTTTTYRVYYNPMEENKIKIQQKIEEIRNE